MIASLRPALRVLICSIAMASVTVGMAMEAGLDSLLDQRDEAVASQLSGRCYRVVDGDSLYLDGVEPQIRLWGVDAPEREERGYRAATENLKRLALGEELRCEQVDTDKYGRIVARCQRHSDHRELNREQIESGVADEYCRFTRGYYRHCR